VLVTPSVIAKELPFKGAADHTISLIHPSFSRARVDYFLSFDVSITTTSVAKVIININDSNTVIGLTPFQLGMIYQPPF
jgi:hypothetical protein